MISAQITEAQRLAPKWDVAHPVHEPSSPLIDAKSWPWQWRADGNMVGADDKAPVLTGEKWWRRRESNPCGAFL